MHGSRGAASPTRAATTAGKGRKVSKINADLLERCYADPPAIGAFEAIPPQPPRADADGVR